MIYGANQRAENDYMSLADWIASTVELSDRVWRHHAEGAPLKSLGEILDQDLDTRPTPATSSNSSLDAWWRERQAS